MSTIKGVVPPIRHIVTPPLPNTSHAYTYHVYVSTKTDRILSCVPAANPTVSPDTVTSERECVIDQEQQLGVIEQDQQLERMFEVGDDIAKMFGGELYRGFIVDVDEGSDAEGVLYSVQYEDGDEEDLNQKECVEAVDLYEKLESGEIDEWELGDE